MSHFLYLSDVFCPWCYGFAPVMQRLAAEHPDLPVRVLGGDLVGQATTLTEMKAGPRTCGTFSSVWKKPPPSLWAVFWRLWTLTGPCACIRRTRPCCWRP